MSGSWWVTFEDGTSVCCEGRSAFDAKKIAEHITGKKGLGESWNADGVQSLPYPADPCVWQLDHPVYGKTPRFCYSPKTCAGKGSCPKQPACSE